MPSAIKIISGGQTGVDRAALDVALALSIPYGGWCPRGGWAEDHPQPPGVLDKYPLLRETPLADPAQRTEWNVRDSDATLLIVDARGLPISPGTTLARELAERHAKPLLVIDVSAPDAPDRAREWLQAQRGAHDRILALGVGGPRESEAPGIYGRAKLLLHTIFDPTC